MQAPFPAFQVSFWSVRFSYSYQSIFWNMGAPGTWAPGLLRRTRSARIMPTHGQPRLYLQYNIAVTNHYGPKIHGVQGLQLLLVDSYGRHLLTYFIQASKSFCIVMCKTMSAHVSAMEKTGALARIGTMTKCTLKDLVTKRTVPWS